MTNKIKADLFLDLENKIFRWNVIEKDVTVKEVGSFYSEIEKAQKTESAMPYELLSLIMEEYKEVCYEAVFKEDKHVEVEILFEDKKISMIYAL